MSLVYLQKKSKALRSAVANSDGDAVQRVAAVLRAGTEAFSLQKAQHIVAVEAGFKTWGALRAASDVALGLAVAMDKVPLLRTFGVGISGRSTPERRQKFLGDREALRSELEDISWTMQWLRENVRPIKTINMRHSSYGWKHVAERYAPHGYLTNGVLIASAMMCGYPYRIMADSVNAYFGMSERSWSEMDQRTPRP